MGFAILAALFTAWDHVRRNWKVYVGPVVLVLTIGGGLYAAKKIRQYRLEQQIIEANEAARKAEAKGDVHTEKGDQLSPTVQDLERQRAELEKQIETIRRQRAAGQSKLAERKRTYEDAKGGQSILDPNGSLDMRERHLLTILDYLYPSPDRTRSADN